MKRELAAFIASLCVCISSTAASPPVVGIISMDKSTELLSPAFREGLQVRGHVDGKTLRFVSRNADGDDRRFTNLAREVLRRKPVVIFTICGSALRAIRDVDRQVPVVAICAEWDNYHGEVTSMARPGGRTTGFFMISSDLASKRLQLLREIRPELARVAVLHNRVDSWRSHWTETERAASTLGITLLPLPPVEGAVDIENSLTHAVSSGAEALIVFPDATTYGAATRIAEIAIKHRLLSAFDGTIFAVSGGLLSYGPDLRDMLSRVMPRYVDQILKGMSPAELPIEQPTKFELVINLRTAKALGIKIPPSVLLRADRVIE